MDADLISYESMLAARDSANWAFWGMVAAVTSAIATITTAFIAGGAAWIAYKTMSSWKEQERQKQLVLALRAIFNYRYAAERIYESSDYEDARKSIFEKNMLTFLGDVFHELTLAKFLEDSGPEWTQFKELRSMHIGYISGKVELKKVLNAVNDLQEMVRNSLE